ncbi:hypothetical protein [Pseudomonas putida]
MNIANAFKAIGSLKSRIAESTKNPIVALLLVVVGGAYIPTAMWLANTYQFDYLLYPVLLLVMFVALSSGRKNARRAG